MHFFFGHFTRIQTVRQDLHRTGSWDVEVLMLLFGSMLKKPKKHAGFILFHNLVFVFSAAKVLNQKGTKTPQRSSWKHGEHGEHGAP